MKKNVLNVGLALLTVLSVNGLAACGSSKEFVGFDTDLAKAVGEQLKVEVKFQEIVWEQKEIELNSKNIDVIWNGFTITEERKAALSFSIPYMENKQVVVGKNDYGGLKEGSSYKVAVEAGSAGSDAFDASSAFASSEKIETTDQISALTEVLSGTSDLAIIDKVMAGYYLNDDSSYGSRLKMFDVLNVESEFYGIGVRKGEEGLTGKLNEALQNVYQSGKTKEIADKYGLASSLVSPASFTPYSSLSETSSFDYILKKGNLVVGYTVFAPIAFFK
jgi:polar amino acid transport system substrate-binding protein